MKYLPKVFQLLLRISSNNYVARARAGRARNTTDKVSRLFFLDLVSRCRDAQSYFTAENMQHALTQTAIRDSTVILAIVFPAKRSIFHREPPARFLSP